MRKIKSDADFIFLKTIVESDGFVPSNYGRSTAPMLSMMGLIEPYRFAKPVRWTVHERNRQRGNVYRDSKRQYDDVTRGWRLTRDTERAVLTMCAHRKHRNILRSRIDACCLPRITHVEGAVAIDMVSKPDDTVIDWCFENDVALLHCEETYIQALGSMGTAGRFTEIRQRVYVEESRAVEFKLRFSDY